MEEKSSEMFRGGFSLIALLWFPTVLLQPLVDCTKHTYMYSDRIRQTYRTRNSGSFNGLAQGEF